MRLLNTRFVIFSILITVCASCGENQNKDLDAREKKLDLKEQQLLNWEQQLKLKEQELSKNQMKIDSIKNLADTNGIYDPKVIGNWKVTMQCTETTCEGSAVGDTKTEVWSISYHNHKVIARVIVNKKVIRTYSGLFRENTLQLSARQTSETDTHMDVTLTPHSTTEGLLEGQRVINQRGKCRIVYGVKAEKI